MRIYELNPILDGDILGSQVLALDDSTQTRKISLDQIRVFLGVGENSTLIPTGTDIHVYFLTAKSGSYYGEGLLNTAHGGAWAAFDWTTHDQGRGTLIETNNVNELAVHSLAAGAWTKKKIISEAGGTFLDRVTIERDNDGIRLQNDTQGKPIYLLCNDADGTNRFYLGVGDDATNDVALYNYIGGGNRVTVADNGSIELSPRGVGTVVTNGIHEITGTSSSQLHFVELDTGKKYIFVCDGGNFRLDEDSTAGSNVLTWTSEGNKLFVNGRVSMFDYGEFDARYYTQSGANAKFVQGIQLGARVAYNANKGDGQETHADAGHCLTGVSTTHANEGAGELINIYAKPIQRNINGVWATIPG